MSLKGENPEQMFWFDGKDFCFKPEKWDKCCRKKFCKMSHLQQNLAFLVEIFSPEIDKNIPLRYKSDYLRKKAKNYPEHNFFSMSWNGTNP